MSETDHAAVLNAIREKLVEGRRRAALSFDTEDSDEDGFAWYQTRIDLIDRAIADEQRLRPATFRNTLDV